MALFEIKKIGMRVGISKPLVALILAIASIIVIIVFISCQKDKKKEVAKSA